MIARSFFANRCLRWSVALFLAVFTALPLQAAEVKIEARLIWGTNDDKYSNPQHTRVDEATAEKLRKIFKWKNYFQMSKQTAVIPSRGTKRLKMSDPCEIEITEMEGPRVEVKLFGKGKPVSKFVKPLSKGESLAIGGEDKNDCAWFIVITDLEEK